MSEKKDSLKSIGAIYKFALEGDGGVTFVVDLKNELTVKEGDGPAEVHDSDVGPRRRRPVRGRANGQALFFTG